MKKITLFTLIFTIVMSACQKEKKHSKYSCNPVIQKYVELNYDNLTSLSALDFGNLPLDTAIAVYNAIDSQERYDFWYDRIDNFSNMECMDAFQVGKLNALKSQLSVNLFNTQITTADTSFDTWMGNWLTQSSSYFTSYQLFCIVASHKPFDDCPPSMPNIGSHSGGSGGGTSSCTCNFEKDWCDWLNPSQTIKYVCTADNCEGSSLGCGTLWRFACEGRCALSL